MDRLFVATEFEPVKQASRSFDRLNISVDNNVGDMNWSKCRQQLKKSPAVSARLIKHREIKDKPGDEVKAKQL